MACLFRSVGIDNSGLLQQSDVKANPHLTVVNKQWGLETVPSTHTVDASFQRKIIVHIHTNFDELIEQGKTFGILTLTFF